MLVTSSGSPLLIAGQKIITPGRFVDNFQRGTTFQSTPVGMGWTDMGVLQPQNYDLSHIYNGAVGSGDPYWRGKNGAAMAPDDQWAHYEDYPGLAVGGLGALIRNVGDGIYNYDVTCRIGGVIHGIGGDGPEAEATPIVGVNTATDKLGYGAWLVNFGDTQTPLVAFIIGYVGNPPEEFRITHISGGIAHNVNGQERVLTLKYRATGFTVWLDGVQISLTEFDHDTQTTGTSIGTAMVPVDAAHQNKSWAGFEYDQHITAPDLMMTNPSILSYSHQAIT